MEATNHHHYSARVALGMRLKHWRSLESRKISEVAAMLGVSTSTWGHWETGERLPSGDLLLAIEDLTGIPLYVLFCPHLDTCPHGPGGQIPTKNQPCCRRGVHPCAPESNS
jgi:transcriptional regulator with XRE-family HTH domain